MLSYGRTWHPTKRKFMVHDVAAACDAGRKCRSSAKKCRLPPSAASSFLKNRLTTDRGIVE